MRRLASDDEFREAMERDPAATLVGAGVSPSKEDIPKKVKLPTKAALRARLKKLADKKWTTDLPHIPFTFGDVVRGSCETEADTKPRKAPKPTKPTKAKKGASGSKKGK